MIYQRTAKNFSLKYREFYKITPLKCKLFQRQHIFDKDNLFLYWLFPII